MKKSQMQRMLAGFLSTIYETNKHPEEQFERAKMVLDFMEGEGLKPPLTKRCPVLLTSIHTWESEQNET